MTPAEHMALHVKRIVDQALTGSDGQPAPLDLYPLVIGAAEKPLIEAVLARFCGNQSHAALTLGINRNTLRAKMRAHGIKA